MQVKGHVALITGGASGLGEATARALAALGAKVGILDMNAERAEAVAKELGGVALIADVTSEESVLAALAKLKAEAGSAARIVVNCAGIAPSARLVGKNGPHSLELYRKVIEINLIGTFNVMRLAAADMMALDKLEEGDRGVIINTASVAGYEGQIGQIAYAASKGGVISMTVTAARDMSNMGIRVNTIAPGLFITPMFMTISEDFRKSLESSIPFPSRLGTAQEYAKLAMAIVDNVYINGETIRLDGALRMAPR